MIALTHQSLYDGSIVSKLLVLADEHTQFFVVDTDIASIISVVLCHHQYNS